MQLHELRAAIERPLDDPPPLFGREVANLAVAIERSIWGRTPGDTEPATEPLFGDRGGVTHAE